MTSIPGRVPRGPEPWLRGPVAGIPATLQAAAHIFLNAREDIDAAVANLTAEQIWLRPNGIASIGFHLAHLAGATDRLMTYARGEALNESQRAALGREKAIDDTRPPLDTLLNEWHQTIDASLRHLAATPESSLADFRGVGKAQLPSTVHGLIAHAAEHAARHAGQIATTAKWIRGATAL